MNKLQYIYDTMKDVTNKTPILLVGGASFLFKRLYKGNIHRLESTEECKDFIATFYGVEYNKPIVVEDISQLYRDTILLKLIEEIKLPLILLASEDNLSETLQSRIKTYIKFPADEDLSCSFASILDTQEHLDSNELTLKQADKYIAENCPSLAELNSKMVMRKNKDKIINIMGGLQNDRYSKS